MFAEIDTITAQYGKSLAIRDVSVQVPDGAVIAMIGANGAGKSTVLKALAGLVPLHAGHIRFRGESIAHLETYARVRKGIVLVPEGRQLFPHLSVLTNNKQGISVLLVEQNAHLALGVASRGYVLEVGRVVAQGTVEELSRSDIVRKAYLGG